MSLLVPDYTSSSEDDEALDESIATPRSPMPDSVSVPPRGTKSESTALSTVASPTSKLKPKRTKTLNKFKTVLYLPPAIQRLLETGNQDDEVSDSSDEESELLAKHRAAKKAAKKQTRPAATATDSVLSFLPLPKHQEPGLESLALCAEAQGKSRQGLGGVTGEDGEATSAAWQEYYQQQQQQQYQDKDTAATLQEYCTVQGEDDVCFGDSLKRKRTRERDIERALQNGHFEAVAGQIAEVHGPMSNAWQPPVDLLTGASGSSDHEVRVKASFWNARAGTTVSSIKPSRLQRQKHQLNQLAFDAKARDFELLDKRSASLKTKRETYAKYGW